ncbi:MAG TPA: hypothetical protein VKD91_18080, partial [Pyrinomonadaceae bacterium]|nr:hypothetical protein [Pyrinomonadaceae bacterium]
YAMRLSYFADFDAIFKDTPPGLSAVFAQFVSSPAKRRDESEAAYGEESSGEFAGWKSDEDAEDIEPAHASGSKVKWLAKGEYWVTRIEPDSPVFAAGGEHRYRIEPINPTPQPLKISTFAAGAQPTFQGLLSQLEQHKEIMLRRSASSAIVPRNNVSDVTFPSSTTVRQDVWWRFSGLESQPPAWFARTYDVDMTPPQPPTMPEPR